MSSDSSTSKPKAIHFGAGNIGRGFIGPILVESGYHVVFADVNKGIIEKLNHEHHYEVHILDEQNKEIEVDDVSGVLSTTDDIIKEIADPRTEIVTTAVGLIVLERISGTIAKGISARRESGGKTLNVIACENAVGATSRLHKVVDEKLSEEDKTYVSEYVGFANCSVDRIVPPTSPYPEEHALDVDVENFHEWVVEAPSLKQPRPHIKDWKLTHHLPAYNERKLFTLNTGHAIAAYLGYLKGLHTIDEAINDNDVHKVVRGALEESGAALIKKHGFKKEEHEEYIAKIEQRFKNKAVRDEVARVGRQPLRKLGREDRLVGPTRMASEEGVPVHHLPVGIAAALHYDDTSDEQSRELQKDIKEKGVEVVVREVTGFEDDTDVHRKIVEAYHGLKKLKPTA